MIFFLSNHYINLYTYYTIFTRIYGSLILSKKITYEKKKKEYIAEVDIRNAFFNYHHFSIFFNANIFT